MKIVLIGTVSSSIFGFRKALLQDLVEAGLEVYIFTTDLTGELKARAKSELNVNAELYGLDRTGINPFSDILATIYLARRLRRISPDIVFSYFSKPIIFGTFAARLAGVKVCYGMVEGLGHYFTNDPAGNSFKRTMIRRLLVLLFHLSMPLLKGLVVLNPDDKKDLLEVYKVKIEKIMVLGGIGLDLTEYSFEPVDCSSISFIFVGRLLAEKGINEYLRAAEIVKARFPEVVFNVLGSTDSGNPGSVDLKYLSELVKRKIIIYPGSVQDVVNWLRSSSVFVLPSYYREGVPMSTQEAMAVGRSIITTSEPGCRETVVDGETGIFVPPHDPVKLAEAMVYFIENPDEIVRMGIASRRRAEEMFDANKVNKRLLKFLNVSSRH